MGTPVEGRQGRITFVGESQGDADNPARLEEALQSAAERVVAEGLTDIPFDVVQQQVVFGNQHVKTFKVVVSSNP